VGLAAALLAAPDVLLLDEPTSNLDLEALEWLEETLRRYRGLVMVVSHDRYFLDAVVTRILELADGELRGFAGDYTAYRREKDRLAAEQASVYRKQRREVEALKSAVRRERQWFDSAARGPRRSGEPGGFAGKYRDRATKHSTRFQAKEKRLERIDAERVEKPRMAATIEPKFGRVAINPRSGRATINPRSGGMGSGQARFLLRTTDLGMAYPGRPLFAGANLALERGTELPSSDPTAAARQPFCASFWVRRSPRPVGSSGPASAPATLPRRPRPSTRGEPCFRRWPWPWRKGCQSWRRG
jgi:ATP-binding cassette subfamily F protein 3